MCFRAFRPICAAIVMSSAVVAAYAEPAIVDVAISGDVKALRSLLRQGADLGAAQSDGMTALHWAVQRRDLAMTDALLDAGADYALTNRTGVRPLYLAAVNGDA